MTCDECRQAIAVADLTDWGDMHAVATHCHTCPSCAVVVTEVRDSAQRVARLLDGIPPGIDSAVVARRAEATAFVERERSRRRRFVARVAGGVALAGAAAVFAIARRTPALSMTVPLRCLSSVRAAALLTPQVGQEGAIEMHRDDPALITIRGPAWLLKEAQVTLDRADAPLPAGVCDVGANAGAATGWSHEPMSAAQEHRMADRARVQAEAERRAAAEARRQR